MDEVRIAVHGVDQGRAGEIHGEIAPVGSVGEDVLDVQAFGPGPVDRTADPPGIDVIGRIECEPGAQVLEGRIGGVGAVGDEPAVQGNAGVEARRRVHQNIGVVVGQGPARGDDDGLAGRGFALVVEQVGGQQDLKVGRGRPAQVRPK